MQIFKDKFKNLSKEEKAKAKEIIKSEPAVMEYFVSCLNECLTYPSSDEFSYTKLGIQVEYANFLVTYIINNK